MGLNMERETKAAAEKGKEDTFRSIEPLLSEGAVADVDDVQAHTRTGYIPRSCPRPSQSLSFGYCYCPSLAKTRKTEWSALRLDVERGPKPPRAAGYRGAPPRLSEKGPMKTSMRGRAGASASDGMRSLSSSCTWLDLVDFVGRYRCFARARGGSGG